MRIDADVLAKEQRFLLRLVVTVAARKEGEAGADRPVEKIWLGESKHKAALQTAELRGERKGFAQAEEIVGLIGQADEPAGESADAAVQADRLLALLLDLQIEVDRSFLRVALDFDGFVGFDAVEIIQLVEAKDADFPGALVE